MILQLWSLLCSRQRCDPAYGCIGVLYFGCMAGVWRGNHDRLVVAYLCRSLWAVSSVVLLSRCCLYSTTYDRLHESESQSSLCIFTITSSILCCNAFLQDSTWADRILFRKMLGHLGLDNQFQAVFCLQKISCSS